MARPGGAIDGAEVGQKREQPETARQHVATLGRPRDRFDPERMNREGEGTDGGRACQTLRRNADPARPSAQQCLEHEPHEDGVRRVQHEVRQVIAERVHAPERMIDREREPGERLEMPAERRRHHPMEVRRPEPPVRMVLGQIQVVVPIDEPVLERGREAHEHREDEADRDAPAYEGTLRHRDAFGCHESATSNKPGLRSVAVADRKIRRCITTRP